MNMKSKFKILIMLFIFVLIMFKLGMNSKDIKLTYEDVAIYKKGIKVDEIDIKIDVEEKPIEFILKEFKFSKQLDGVVYIGDEKYHLTGSDMYMFPNLEGEYTDYGLHRGYLSKGKKIDDELEFYFDIKQDYSKLYIESSDGQTEIVYPVSADDEYLEIREFIDSTNI